MLMPVTFPANRPQVAMAANGDTVVVYDQLDGATLAILPGDPGRVAKIAELFDRARIRADVCVYTITDDRISGAILDALHRALASAGPAVLLLPATG